MRAASSRRHACFPTRASCCGTHHAQVPGVVDEVVSENNFIVVVTKPGAPGASHTNTNVMRHRLVQPVKDFRRDEEWVGKALDVCGFVFAPPRFGLTK